MRPNWQTQHGVGQHLGNRKCATRPPLVSVRARKMRGHRIMNQCADPRFAKLALQFVAFWMLDHKEVPNRLNPLRHEGQDKLRVESRPVVHSDTAAGGELSEV